MGFIGRVGQFFAGIIILLTIITFLPGLPPNGRYQVEDPDPTLKLEGALAPNTILDGTVRLFENRFNAPESVATRGRGNEIFLSMHGGSIVKVYGENYASVKEVAKIGPGCKDPWEEHVCGRPLGLRFARDGKLLVADSYLGIFKVDVDTGKKERLLDSSLAINGARPMLVDDLDEDSQGNIYWTDASSLVPLVQSMLEILVGPSGRFLKLDVTTGQSLVLLDNLHFSNGVQLSPDEDFVLVCETLKNRVLRYWLKGPRAGTHDYFVKGLPGFPDNIRARPAGGYYLSLVSVKDHDALDLIAVLDRLPWLRRLLARILYGTKRLLDGFTYLYNNDVTPQIAYKLLYLGPVAELFTGNRSMVVQLDEAGNIVTSLQGGFGAVKLISEATQVDDKLFFGSPYNNYLGMISMDKVDPSYKKTKIPRGDQTVTITMGGEVEDTTPPPASEKESVKKSAPAPDAKKEEL